MHRVLKRDVVAAIRVEALRLTGHEALPDAALDGTFGCVGGLEQQARGALLRLVLLCGAAGLVIAAAARREKSRAQRTRAGCLQAASTRHTCRQGAGPVVIAHEVPPTC